MKKDLCNGTGEGGGLVRRDLQYLYSNTLYFSYYSRNKHTVVPSLFRMIMMANDDQRPILNVAGSFLLCPQMKPSSAPPFTAGAAVGGAGAAYGTPPTLRDPASPDTPDTAFVVGAGNPENAASGLPHDARGTSDLHENIRVLFSDEDAPDDEQRGDELV